MSVQYNHAIEIVWECMYNSLTYLYFQFNYIFSNEKNYDKVVKIHHKAWHNYITVYLYASLLH